MRFYFSKNILNNSKRRGGLALAGALLIFLLVGCSTSEPDTFIRFQVEGKSYEVEDPTLTITRMPFDLHFFDLTYPNKRLTPGAMIQWRMKEKLESVEQLVGKNLDLKAIDPNQMEPVAIFRMTQDLSAQSKKNSNVHFKVDRIENGFIEGSFIGKDFFYISKNNAVIGKINVTAEFRARLIQKGE